MTKCDPCCDSSKDGPDCHFRDDKQDANSKSQRASLYGEYKRLEEDNKAGLFSQVIDSKGKKKYDQSRYKQVINPAYKKTLGKIVDARSKYNLHLKDNCLTCDANGKDHQTRLESAEEAYHRTPDPPALTTSSASSRKTTNKKNDSSAKDPGRKATFSVLPEEEIAHSYIHQTASMSSPEDDESIRTHQEEKKKQRASLKAAKLSEKTRRQAEKMRRKTERSRLELEKRRAEIATRVSEARRAAESKLSTRKSTRRIDSDMSEEVNAGGQKLEWVQGAGNGPLRGKWVLMDKSKNVPVIMSMNSLKPAVSIDGVKVPDRMENEEDGGKVAMFLRLTPESILDSEPKKKQRDTIGVHTYGAHLLLYNNAGVIDTSLYGGCDYTVNADGDKVTINLSPVWKIAQAEVESKRKQVSQFRKHDSKTKKVSQSSSRKKKKTRASNKKTVMNDFELFEFAVIHEAHRLDPTLQSKLATQILNDPDFTQDKAWELVKKRFMEGEGFTEASGGGRKSRRRNKYRRTRIKF